MMIMGFQGTGLGDWQTAVEGLPGVSDAIDFIQGKAKTGAEQAIPTIQQAIQPYVVGALLLGVGGFLFGLAAFFRTRKS